MAGPSTPSAVARKPARPGAAGEASSHLRSPRQHHRLISLIAIVYLWVIVSATLTPFEFDRGRLPADPLAIAALLRAATPNVPDVLANIALYVPIGLLAWMALRQRGITRRTATVGTALLGISLSLTCEVCQIAEPSRVASLWDIAANIVGCTLGLLVSPFCEPVYARMRSQLQRDVLDRPFTIAARYLVAALFVVLLWPFDVTPTRSHVLAAVRGAHWSPVHHWQHLTDAQQARVDSTASPVANRATAARAVSEYMLHLVAQASAYALLACQVTAALRREFDFRRFHATILTLWLCGLFAGVICASRLFLASHGLDTMHILIGMAGALTGIAMCFLSGLDGSLDRSRRAARRLSAALSGLVVVYLLVSEATPLPWGAAATVDAHRTSVMNWIPFRLHASSRFNAATLDVSAKWLLYALFGAMLAHRCRVVGRESISEFRVVLLAGLLSMTLQIAHQFMPGRHGDITNVLIAIIGAASGFDACRAACLQIRQAIERHVARRAAASTFAWDEALVHEIVRSQPLATMRASSREHVNSRP